MKANEKCYDIWKMGKKVRLGFWFRFLLIIYAVILSFSFNSDPNLKNRAGVATVFSYALTASGRTMYALYKHALHIHTVETCNFAF